MSSACANPDCEKECQHQKSNPELFYKYCSDCTDGLRPYHNLYKAVKELEKARSTFDSLTLFDADKLTAVSDTLARLAQEITSIAMAKVGEKRKRI